MDTGPVVASSPLTNGLSSSKDDSEDLDDFELRLDEDDINCIPSSDEDLKEDELLNPKDNDDARLSGNNAEDPDCKDSLAKKVSLENEPKKEEVGESEKKIPQDEEKGFRNTNHDRLPIVKLEKSEINKDNLDTVVNDDELPLTKLKEEPKTNVSESGNTGGKNDKLLVENSNSAVNSDLNKVKIKLEVDSKAQVGCQSTSDSNINKDVVQSGSEKSSSGIKVNESCSTSINSKPSNCVVEEIDIKKEKNDNTNNDCLVEPIKQEEEENIDAVDKELDSLLQIEDEIFTMKAEETSEENNPVLVVKVDKDMVQNTDNSDNLNNSLSEKMETNDPSPSEIQEMDCNEYESRVKPSTESLDKSDKCHSVTDSQDNSDKSDLLSDPLDNLFKEDPLTESQDNSPKRDPLADPLDNSAKRDPLADPLGNSAKKDASADPLDNSAKKDASADPLGNSTKKDVLADPLENSSKKDPLENSSKKDPLADPLDNSAIKDPLADSLDNSPKKDPLADPLDNSSKKDPLADPLDNSAKKDPLADSLDDSAKMDPLADPLDNSAKRDPLTDSDKNEATSKQLNTNSDNMAVDDNCDADSDSMDFEDAPIDASDVDDTATLSAQVDKDVSEALRKTSLPNDCDLPVSKSNKRGADSDTEGKIKKARLSVDEKLVNGYGKNKRVESEGEDFPVRSKVRKRAKEITTEPSKLVNGQIGIESNILNRTRSKENPEHYKRARSEIFKNYFEGNKKILVDRDVFEETVMLKIVEYVAHGRSTSNPNDLAYYMQRNRFLENEQVRLIKLANSLKKQVEDAKHIIKKLIDEKVNHVPWTQHAMPLRVTRSVGLQVCTCGTVNMTSSRTKDADSVRQLLKQAKGNDSNDNDDVMVVGEQAPPSRVNDVTSKPIDPLKTSLDKTPVANKLPSTQNKPSDKAVLPPKNGLVTPQIKTPPAGPISKPKLSPDTPRRDTLQPKTNSTDKKPDESTLIDLTDNDDVPVKPASTPQPNPLKTGVSVKPLSALCKPDKSNIASKENVPTSTPPQRTVFPSKKPSPVTPTSTSKRPGVSSSGAELVNSFEQLPKLPPTPKYTPDVVRPPKPILRIGKNNSGKQGIMLSWSFDAGKNTSNIEEYQLFAYQESRNSDKVRSEKDTWKKVGDIKALPLPMACFLTQFVEGHKYHFIVRAVDKHKRIGDFSMPGSIILQSALSAGVSTAKKSN